MIYIALLVIHISAGLIALLTGYSAIIVKRGSPRHKQLGRIYVYAMGIVAITAYIMSVIKINPFLFGIAVFTTYFIYTGWSSVGRRWKTFHRKDQLAAALFFVAGVTCLSVLGYLKLKNISFDKTFATTGLVFSCIAIILSIRDFITLKKGVLSPRNRIIKHLTSMMAGLIATTTAVAVTMVGFAPAIPPITAWLGPTIILTPLIIYWTREQKYKQA